MLMYYITDETSSNVCAFMSERSVIKHCCLLSVFLIEAALRIMACGLSAYLESGWNVFDLSVTLLALMGAVLLTIAPKLFIVVMFRPLR